MSIFLFTHPFHLEFRYSIHGWLYGGDSMIEFTVTTTCRLQDLFDKNHPISFESTYIRAHNIPLFVQFWPVLQNLVACRGFKTMPLFNCLLSPCNDDGSRLPCKQHRKNKFIASRQTCSAESRHTELYSLSGMSFCVVAGNKSTRLSGTQACHFGFPSNF